jgi:hypothetical protein
MNIAPNEVWKDVVGYDGYNISNKGRIRSLDKMIKIGNKSQFLRKGRLLKLQKDRALYLRIRIFKNGIRKSVRLHRLVAIAFIPNSFGKREVNHINGIRCDNRVENLEWLTKSENMAHAVKMGSFKGSRKYKRKPVLMLSLENDPLLCFYSITEAEHNFNRTKSHITDVCKGKRITAFGYKWNFFEEGVV